MAVTARNLKLIQRGNPAARLSGGAAEPVQLPLLFSPPKPIETVAPKGAAVSTMKRLLDIRLGSMDQRLSTRDVVLVVGVNRSTIFRWTKIGRFPQRHKSGGWLRSDVERWLAEHAGEDDFAD